MWPRCWLLVAGGWVSQATYSRCRSFSAAYLSPLSRPSLFSCCDGPPPAAGKYGPLPQLNGTEIKACDWESWTRSLPQGLELQAAEVRTSVIVSSAAITLRMHVYVYDAQRESHVGAVQQPNVCSLATLPFFLPSLPQAIYGQGVADAKAWLAERKQAGAKP